mmetsp:Transcript_39251/g.79274  ORF Transcript_39251/g.79274 Transcript_39251/m.79274 type:complete len:290 (-) Transcript_39251:36-905(-)|eukprot:CAMPEP_0171737290 /NCGR_PEP_ID=MMETSP0991-20121206/32842_1 /TAXON_ID=483369 /ORGANISM="non described non described, Strain CCMP2098" /LENGTH=289 /DNA_ID=CAMNT_0012334273 /DNA_START=54 /DNA_END=923 /DNA_ORIENTATION=+
MSCTLFGLTAVHYAQGDPLGNAMALASLAPMFIVAQTVALLAVRRDWQTFIFIIGLLLNVIINKLLKDMWKEPRPSHLFCGGDSGVVGDIDAYSGFGMPSNHAQFMTYVATTTTLFLFARVKASSMELLAWSLAAWALTAATCLSRVHLGYHTQQQVFVGIIAGSIISGLWFTFYLLFLEALGQHLVKTRIFRHLLIKETSNVPNVLVAEYQAICGVNDNFSTSVLKTKRKDVDEGIGNHPTAVSHVSIALTFKIERLLDSVEEVAKTLTPTDRAQLEEGLLGVFAKLS